MNDYLNLYAYTFNLKPVDTKYRVVLLEGADIVGYMHKSKPKYFNYKNSNTWRQCKTSDLVTAVLNNIPAHG